MRSEDDDVLSISSDEYNMLLDSRAHVLRLLQSSEQKLVNCEMERDRWQARYGSARRLWLFTAVLLALAIVGHVARSLLK